MTNYCQKTQFVSISVCDEMNAKACQPWEEGTTTSGLLCSTQHITLVPHTCNCAWLYPRGHELRYKGLKKYIVELTFPNLLSTILLALLHSSGREGGRDGERDGGREGSINIGQGT